MFVGFCHQYQQMGIQLQQISVLISPLLQGHQHLTPKLKIKDGHLVPADPVQVHDRMPPASNNGRMTH